MTLYIDNVEDCAGVPKQASQQLVEHKMHISAGN